MIPDEVLLEIFMAMKARFHIENWHQIAHVCRRWRDVAVGAPLLWTHPLTDQHDFTMLMLRRSKDAGLTIRLDENTWYPTAQAILNYIGRIESLKIEPAEEPPHAKGYFSQQVLLPGLAQEASRLRSLTIDCPSEVGTVKRCCSSYTR
ncbi:hypothetical protein D9619_005223 [Psilocybe cf. subviscida]|uniref:F-box domain-containing protein n=1 Tax=Psilocybe cf. subviscida TaxID=2480587 RepID=A0A8H5BYS0_9AGAR|nr:hypothetical protein D9619_005223 [Psilocybe cf. subviscida]